MQLSQSPKYFIRQNQMHYCFENDDVIPDEETLGNFDSS